MIYLLFTLKSESAHGM